MSGAVAGLELLGHPAERTFQAKRMKLGRRPVADGAGSVRADGEDRPRRMRRQGVPGHAVALAEQPIDQAGRFARGKTTSTPAWVSARTWSNLVSKSTTGRPIVPSVERSM